MSLASGFALRNLENITHVCIFVVNLFYMFVHLFMYISIYSGERLRRVLLRKSSACIRLIYHLHQLHHLDHLHITSYNFIYPHISSYILIYLHISSYIFIYLHISSYIFIYPHISHLHLFSLFFFSLSLSLFFLSFFSLF